MYKTVQYWKMVAIGNEFVLIHGEDVPCEADYGELARTLCNRKGGVGADGLLILFSRVLRMFNPDGSEDFCGNGLRCAAVHGFSNGSLRAEDVILHQGVPVQISMTGESRSKIKLPPASFEPEHVPIRARREIFSKPILIANREREISCLSTGSTHTVLFSPCPVPDDEFIELGTALENHPLFPRRTSTMFACPLDDRYILMRPFERGVGETRGCGTGSAAVVVVWARKSGLSGRFAVVNTGGMVEVCLDDWTGSITLESEVSMIESGHFCIEKAPNEYR